MKKKSSASSVAAKPARKKKGRTPDNEIDYSDIPKLTDRQLKSMVRLGRPLIGNSARQLISIRLDTHTLLLLKMEAAKQNKGYQTLMNEILEKHFKKKTA